MVQQISLNARMEPEYLISGDIFHNWPFVDDYVDGGAGVVKVMVQLAKLLLLF